MSALPLTLLTTLLALDLATPWEAAYVGDQANGPQVLGLWKFDAEDGSEATGRQPQGTLKGGTIVADGKFGGALESFVGYPEADTSHGFVVPDNPLVNPTGPFTIELWIKPKAEFKSRSNSIAVDKKYAGETGYQLSFGPSTDDDKKPMTLWLGFGSGSQRFVSDPATFKEDEWVHVAATYDGQGTVQFFRNGESVGITKAPGRVAVAAGTLPLSIGDRIGSNYSGCPAYLDEVRLTSGVREFGPLRLELNLPRRTYIRNEAAPAWTATVTNLSREPIDDVEIVATANGTLLTNLNVGNLRVGDSHTHERTFDTTLRPDTYNVEVAATVPGDPPRTVRESFSVTIVPRKLPHQMPVVMWGIGGIPGVTEELARLRRIGFTHCLGGESDDHRLADAEEATMLVSEQRLRDATAMMDEALAAGLQIMGSTSPTHYERYVKDDLQTDRAGQPYKRTSLNPNAPPVMEMFQRAGQSWAKTYDFHPAFDGLLVNSEVRDSSQVSFTQWDEDAYRQEFGTDIPDWVTSKYGPEYSTLPDFPADRVVPDNEPHLAFYRWWWSEGDGWNAAHSAVSHGLHTSARRDLWTFYDPAVRVPPIWGSGGDVDVLSHWSYTDPDPLRIAVASDELQAMASGRQPKARVMKMTQLFWYRSSAAPIAASPREGKSPAEWVDRDPDAAYFSIHPMHLREAFWTKIARPIEGIMYHGWSSLVPTDGSHAYKYTHPGLQPELTRLIHEVVEPLGPTLQQISAEPSDVAFLESFTSSVFAGRGTWGYAGSWQADMYLVTLYARLQPRILYEQHILRDGLDGYRVLVMADCDVLPRSVVDRVLAFQQRGGIVVGDERLCPAIKADVTVPVTVPHQECLRRQGGTPESRCRAA